ncbi:MAG TPA: hypothetical protein VHF92_03095 [Geodermatophilus sp.]|nr:hypothetical protein [Geodermatophilus sp.]
MLALLAVSAVRALHAVREALMSTTATRDDPGLAGPWTGAHHGGAGRALDDRRALRLFPTAEEKKAMAEQERLVGAGTTPHGM